MKKRSRQSKSYHELRADTTGEQIVIRPYQEGDVFLGETLEKTVWSFLPRFMRPVRLKDGTIRTAPVCEPWGSYIFDVFSHVDDLSSNQNKQNLVALSKDKVVGVCLVDAKKKYIQALCVHPEFRKSNLGSTLLTRALNDLYRQYGNVAVTLTSMPQAIPFYQRHGFVLRERNALAPDDDADDGEVREMIRPAAVAPTKV